ncbi:hypothetical protein BC830DRAFT_1109215 [Chytriomyces sp. MP71]|nr:hypothetical protein BC830DRAFT_1109215 [Chytriomyces sp. MP71]
MEPLSLLNISFQNMDFMTSLAKYRNGGLFVDTGILTPKPDILARGLAAASLGSIVPRFEDFDDAVVEWRALTVALLDHIGDRVRTALNMSSEKLPLVKVLETGAYFVCCLESCVADHAFHRHVETRSRGGCQAETRLKGPAD